MDTEDMVDGTVDMAAQDTATSEAVSTDLDRAIKVERLISKCVMGSAGVGLIPIPFLDAAGLAAVQISMLRSLTGLYGVEFRKDRAKYIIGMLVGSVLPAGIAGGMMRTVSVVPVIGPLVGMATMPALGGASTYALARVMIQHLESGGTFLTFDPEKVKGFFKEQFESGKAFVKNLHKPGQEAPAVADAQA